MENWALTEVKAFNYACQMVWRVLKNLRIICIIFLIFYLFYWKSRSDLLRGETEEVSPRTGSFHKWPQQLEWAELIQCHESRASSGCLAGSRGFGPSSSAFSRHKQGTGGEAKQLTQIDVHMGFRCFQVEDLAIKSTCRDPKFFVFLPHTFYFVNLKLCWNKVFKTFWKYLDDHFITTMKSDL